ncbi:hypothetical protein [Arthrobacter glacialis]|uniref:Uncharacterized protein n=1 Tax=Arthrobacter glacialis TaxID=1664 RepID=A0A2S3ZUT6_ARTGL|nr:hypothetical protein [Arthrobacter glacialis]POH73021.1 hypothetical protein CVS27_12710 [Arthrobacter glacialis]
MPKSADLTVWGILLLVIGFLVSTFGWAYEITESSSYSGSDGGGAVWGIIGLLTGLTGLIMTLVGIHRALTKIDSLPSPLNPIKNDDQESFQVNKAAADSREPDTRPEPFRI